jgi:hypothetical protein
LVVQEALEFAAELVQGTMDLAAIEVESELVGRDQNPEDPALGNAIEVTVPDFVGQLLLQCGVFERIRWGLVGEARRAAGGWRGMLLPGARCG